jgi:uncharacterized membrane protein YoaK (UPF0700 family)
MEDDAAGGSWGRQHARDIMLLVLTGGAGSADAIAFLALGQVFTANMTGNTVLLGLHLAQEQGAAALGSLIALGGFGAGLLIGDVMVDQAPEDEPWPSAVTRALALEVVLLAAFAVGAYLTGVGRRAIERHGLIALSAIAMGVQSAAVSRLAVPGISTTYVTGTVTSAVMGLVVRPRRAPPAAARLDPPTAHPAGARGPAPSPRRRVGLQLLTVLVYGVGALAAGLAHVRWPSHVTALPFVAVAAVVVAAPICLRPRAAQG